MAVEDKDIVGIFEQHALDHMFARIEMLDMVEHLLDIATTDLLNNRIERTGDPGGGTPWASVAEWGDDCFGLTRLTAQRGDLRLSLFERDGIGCAGGEIRHEQEFLGGACPISSIAPEAAFPPCDVGT